MVATKKTTWRSEGIEVLAGVPGDAERILDARGAGVRGRSGALHLEPAARKLLAARVRAAEAARRRRAARLLARDGRRFAAATGESRRCRPTCADRRVEITGPVDRKMVINALNSGAKMFMADFEDSHSPTWAGDARGPGQPARRRAPARSSSPAPKASTTRSTSRPPRCWSARAAGTSTKSTCWSTASRSRRQLFDFGLYFFHNAQALLDQGHRPVFLSAQAGEPSRSAAVERRVRAARKRRWDLPRGHDQGHGADRDDPGRVRDGRDPLRAARSLGGAQLRPLGLHLQLHQEVPQPARVRAARPRAGHDDHALSCAPTRGC